MQIIHKLRILKIQMDNQPNQPSQPNQPTGDKEVQIGKYKVKVIRSACISAGSCIAVSPATFEFDNENKAEVIEKSQDTPENIVLAAQSCPTKAIIITDETGKQIWPS